MITYNSRTRLLTALNHKEPDRVPIDMGGTTCSNITLGAYHNLRTFLNLEPKHYTFDDLGGAAAFATITPDPDILELLHSDVEWVSMGTPDAWQLNIVYGDKNEHDTYIDEWGTTLFHPKGGHYFDFRGFPIQNASLDELKNWTIRPDPLDPGRWRGFREKCLASRLRGRALASSSLIGGGLFEQPARLMPMEVFLMATAADPEFTQTILGIIFDIYLASTVCLLEEIGDILDIWVYWDDLSTQQGRMVSSRWVEKYLKPLYRKLFDTVRSKTKAKILFHMCGAARPWIPHMIDLGVDAINPVQTSAEGMEPAALKRDFGDHITFWGGAVDLARTLVPGTPEQVAEEARRTIDILAPGGGFVFANIHSIQDDVPPENIVAMFEAAYENGLYL